MLFGGTLSQEACRGRHQLPQREGTYDAQFAHRHAVDLAADGLLAAATGKRRVLVNSVHEQCIDRLGTGLLVEAVSTDDGVIEAVRAPSCCAEVLAVQWHPEWNGATERTDRVFFELLGSAVRSGRRDHTD